MERKVLIFDPKRIHVNTTIALCKLSTHEADQLNSLVCVPFQFISYNKFYVHESQANVNIVQWVLDYPNPNYPYPDILTSAHFAMFSVQKEKRRCSHWSFATGESEAAVRTIFLNATMLFPCSTEFRSRFTTSELAERSRKYCSTL